VDGWAQRFLLDAASARLSLPAERAVLGFEELARANAGLVLHLLREEPAAAGHLAAALGRVGEQGLEALVSLLGSHVDDVRLAGVAGLGEAAAQGSKRAVDKLGACLGDPDPRVRRASAAALGAARGPAADAAARWLQRAVEGGDVNAITGAAFGAAALYPARKRAGRRVLLAAAASGPTGLMAAAVAIAQLPRAAGARVANLCTKSRSPAIRGAAAGALARWALAGSHAARRHLDQLLRDDDPLVRAQAAARVAEVPQLADGKTLARLASDRSADVRAAVAEALARRAEPAAAAALWTLAADPAVAVRAAAVRGLGRIGAWETLATACSDAHAPVRAAAAAGLAAAGGGDPALLLQLSRDRDRSVAEAACAALGAVARGPEGAAWDRICEMMGDPGTSRAAGAAAAAALDREPARAASALLRLPGGGTAADVLGEIARAAHAVEVSEVARALVHGMGEGNVLADALGDLAIALDISGAVREADACRWLAASAGACEAACVAAQVDGSVSRAGLPLGHLVRAAQEVRAGLCARRPEQRERRFARARAILDAALRAGPGDVASSLVRRVAESWLAVLEAPPGREDLPVVRARLASTAVIGGPEAEVVVDIENAGQLSVQAIRVAFDGHHVLGAEDLLPGEAARVVVPVGIADGARLRLSGEVRFHCRGADHAVRVAAAVPVVRSGAMPEVANPYVVGKPLAPDSPMFFGRAAEAAFVERALESGEAGSVVVLVGQRRTGKTSLLRRLEARLGRQYRTAFVDVQGMLVGDTQQFFLELERRLRGREYGGWLADAVGDSGVVEAVCESVADSDRRVVLLLDEFDDLCEKVRSGRLGDEVFGCLRHLVQHCGNLSLVLCGTHRLEAVAGEQWSFLLNLAVHHRIGCLDAQAAESVLREPLSRLGIACDDAAVERALLLAGRHPCFLQLLGYHIVEQCVASGEAAVRGSTVEAAADRVVSHGEIHLRYLWDSSGPDERQVLLALARAPRGLAEEDLARATGLGSATLAAALDALASSELVERAAGRRRLTIGLLGRWLTRETRMM